MKRYQQFLTDRYLTADEVRAEYRKLAVLPFDCTGDPNFFYHATPAENIASIRRTGLEPGHGQTFDDLLKDKDLIHLAPHPMAAFYWYRLVNEKTTGSPDTPYGQVVMLRVSNLIPFFHSHRHDEILTHKIPPDQLEVYRENRWQPL